MKNKIIISLRNGKQLSQIEKDKDEPLTKELLQQFFINATGGVKYNQPNGIPMK